MIAASSADPRTTPLPRLAGKVAIVTGATQGIGAATAQLFAAHGAKVVLNVLEDNAQARATLASLATDEAMLFAADITDADAIARMVAAATERFGAPDVLVNNAGINVFNDPLALSDDEWTRCFEVDLKGAWNCAKA
ncbi:MAG: SDR family NAD(P)-dependent oxidoreductase, partial [Luteibacter sp.]